MMAPPAPTSLELPRVLVATSNNFNLRGGGGITLTNLFRGWPRERLANVHEDATPPDRSVCDNFFRLTRREVQWVWPFSIVEPRAAARAGNGTNALEPSGPDHTWKRRLVGDGVPRDVKLSPELTAWIEAFRPQMVYGFLGSTAQMRLMREIADRWQVPAAIHIMDDWPSVIYSEGWLGPLLRPLALREFRHLVDRAAVRLGISRAMADEYTSRYGHPFAAFHNALNMAEWSTAAKTSWSVGAPAVVRYVGSLWPDAQQRAMRQACEAVASLREHGVNVTMHVHAPVDQARPLRQWGFSEEVLRLERSPDASAVPELLARADILILPFNFDVASLKYMRLSMPTKVPAYMISGTPVLVYGPASAATVAYASEGGWAATVTTEGAAPLATALESLLGDEARRASLAKRAMELARRDHDESRVRPAFWATLAAAVPAPQGSGERVSN